MSTKKENPAVLAEQLALYDSLVKTIPNLERKGATVPYTSLNGNMFSYLAKDGSLALRLPRPAREEFLTKYNASLCVAYGIVQKEYVSVPAALLKNTQELKEYFEISFEYVKTLKPKPTRKSSPEK